MAIGSFVVLAMPRAILGVVWPSLADELQRPLADLGFLISALVGGALIVTLANGELTRRFGAGPLLAGSAILSTLALAAIAATPGWMALAVAVALLGGGGGLIDAGVNARIATGFGTRAMGFLHAGYGVGSALAPLMMTVIFALDISWRTGFIVIALLQAGVALELGRNRGSFGVPTVERSKRPRHQWHEDRFLLAITLVAFFLYTGIEVGAGEWAFSLLTEARSLAPVVAGWVVAGFWGGLTISRLVLGAAGTKVRTAPVLGSSAAVALAGMIVMWWNPADWVGAAGLVMTGLALGPYFPLHMLAAAERFGPERTPWMAGYSLAAASVGAITIPAIIGLLVGSSGLEAIGPVLVVATLLLTTTTLVLNRLGAS